VIRRQARLIRIYIGESDRHAARPLYEEIVAQCQEAGVEHAMVYRGIEGYGASTLIHRPGLFGRSRDAPIVITVIASSEQAARLQPALEAIVDEGLIAISEAEIIRFQETADGGR